MVQHSVKLALRPVGCSESRWRNPEGRWGRSEGRLGKSEGRWGITDLSADGAALVFREIHMRTSTTCGLFAELGHALRF